MNLAWVYYFCIVACFAQIIRSQLSYYRTGLKSRIWFGTPAFSLLLIGFILAQISNGPDPIVTRPAIIVPTRAIFWIAGLLWIAEGVYDIQAHITVVGGWTAIWRAAGEMAQEGWQMVARGIKRPGH